MGPRAILAGGPHAGRPVESHCRFYETPVACNGMVCRAVYERTGPTEYLFRGVAHRFQVGPDEYETRLEPPGDWERRAAEGREYAPINLPVGS